MFKNHKVYKIDYSYEVKKIVSIKIKTSLNLKEFENELFSEHKDTFGDLKQKIQSWVENNRKKLIEIDDKDYTYKIDSDFTKNNFEGNSSFDIEFELE